MFSFVTFRAGYVVLRCVLPAAAAEPPCSRHGVKPRDVYEAAVPPSQAVAIRLSFAKTINLSTISDSLSEKSANSFVPCVALCRWPVFSPAGLRQPSQEDACYYQTPHPARHRKRVHASFSIGGQRNGPIAITGRTTGPGRYHAAYEGENETSGRRLRLGVRLR
jgi:hypothetical protein